MTRSRTLLRIARTTRNTVNRRYQSRVCELLDADARHRLLAILSRPLGESRSLWDQVKREPKRSTVPQLKDFLDHLRWLQEQNVAASAFHMLARLHGSIPSLVDKRVYLFLTDRTQWVAPIHIV